MCVQKESKWLPQTPKKWGWLQCSAGLEIWLAEKIELVAMVLAKWNRSKLKSVNFDGTETNNNEEQEEQQHPNTVRRRLTLLLTTVYRNKLYLSNFFHNETYDAHAPL